MVLWSLAVVWLAGCTSAPQTGPRPEVFVFDAQNDPVNPFENRGAKAIVFFFIRTDCPVSNRYAPEMERIAGKYASQGMRFWLVYPEPATSAQEIEGHRKEYRLSLE